MQTPLAHDRIYLYQYNPSNSKSQQIKLIHKVCLPLFFRLMLPSLLLLLHNVFADQIDWYNDYFDSDFVDSFTNALTNLYEYQEYDTIQTFLCPPDLHLCPNNQTCELVTVDQECSDCPVLQKPICHILLNNQIQHTTKSHTTTTTTTPKTSITNRPQTMKPPQTIHATTTTATTTTTTTTTTTRHLYEKPSPIFRINQPHTPTTTTHDNSQQPKPQTPPPQKSETNHSHEKQSRNYRMTTATNTTNCLFYPKRNTFQCLDWTSPSISNDVSYARSHHKQQKRFNLRIHNDQIDDEWQSILLPMINISHILNPDTFEWVSLHIFSPCINHQFVRLRKKNLHKTFTPIQYAILATKVKAHCYLPLTPFRKKLLLQLMHHIQAITSNNNLSKVINKIIFTTERQPTINPSIENSFYQKGIKALFRRVIKNSYSKQPKIIADLLNCTNTLPEIADITVNSRLTKIMKRLRQKPTIQNAITSLLRTSRSVNFFTQSF